VELDQHVERVPLWTWLTQMTGDDPAWTSVAVAGFVSSTRAGIDGPVVVGGANVATQLLEIHGEAPRAGAARSR
jgi:hypothetical protein